MLVLLFGGKVMILRYVFVAFFIVIGLSPGSCFKVHAATVILGVAHPDDDIFFAGGLKRLVDHGHDVYVVYTTTGKNGTHQSLPDISPDELALIRMNEARVAMNEVVGIPLQNVITLAQDDDARNVHTLRDALLRLNVQADLIITFDSAGMYGHPDHIAAFAAFTGYFHRSPSAKALIHIAVPHSAVMRGEHGEIIYDPTDGKSVVEDAVNFVLPLDADMLAAKQQVMASYPSQFSGIYVVQAQQYFAAHPFEYYIFGGVKNSFVGEFDYQLKNIFGM